MKNAVVLSSRIVIVCLVALLSAASVSRADFVYDDFQSTAGLNLAGSATQNGNQIMLTPAVSTQLGAVWAQDLQPVGQGFSTTFTFRGTGMGGGLDADGHRGVDLIGLVIQKTGNNIDSITHYDVATNPRVRIKFDGYRDGGSMDPSSSSVTLYYNGALTLQVDVESLGIQFRDEAVHQGTIIFAQQVLRVLVDNQEVINTPMDLDIIGLSNSYVGFESYSGVGSWAEHDLLSWSFQSIPEPASFLLLCLGGLLIRKKI